MTLRFTPRHLSYIALSIGAIVALYLAACVHVLSRLDTSSMIVVYVLSPMSPESPITFPVPGWVIDMYWTESGREKIFEENEKTNDSVKLLTNVIGPMDILPSYESLDLKRAEVLLTQLVCAKRNDDKAIWELKEFERKWPNKSLGSAIQTCERRHR